MKHVLKLTLVIWSLASLAHAQDLDSLIQALEEHPERDSLRALILIETLKPLTRSDPKRMLSHAQEALQISRRLHLQSLQVTALRGIGNYYFVNGIPDSASHYYQQGLIGATKARNGTQIGQLNYDLGKTYMYLGLNDKAVQHMSTALEEYKKMGETKYQVYVLNALGVIYFNLNDYKTSISFLKDALKIAEKEQVNDSELHNTLNNIGVCLNNLGEQEAAFTYINRALKIRKKLGIPQKIAESYLNLGYVLVDQKSYRPAINIIEKALKIQVETEDFYSQARSLSTLALAHFYLNDRNSINLKKQALEIAKEIDDFPLQAELSGSLADFYYKFKIIDSAYHYQKLYATLKDSVNRLKSLETIEEVKIKYQVEQIEEQYKDELDQEKIKQANEKKRANSAETRASYAEQKNAYIGIAVLVLLLIVTGGTYSIIKVNQTNHQLNLRNKEIEEQRREIEAQAEVLLESNEEITATNEALSNSQKILSKQNKEISDSINYANKIQGALLIQPSRVIEQFPDAMIFFQPREKVSGDVYWYWQTDSSKIIAVSDCTGHGVPGAFVSVIALTLLNQITKVEGITRPDLILNRLHEGIRDALKQRQTNNHDGMDISICAIDEANQTLEFAGAKNPILIFKDGQQEPLLIKGNKMPIGGEQREKERVFTLHRVKWESSIKFYLFTDGFQDQFGGDQDRKFNPKKFRKLIADNCHLPMSMQKEKLEAGLDQWMGNHQRQIDDILIIGISYPAPSADQ